MSDENATGAASPEPKNDEVIEDAVIVDEAVPAETDTVVAVSEPDAAATEASSRVVYLHVPPAPKKRGNRGLGSAIAVVSAIVFTGLLALVYAFIAFLNSGVFAFSFLSRAEFFIPTLFFVIGFVLLVLIVNRASWWAFIIGSLLVGFFVYFGAIGLTLVTAGIITSTPADASQQFALALRAPFFIVAALLAREVALWTGGIISRRGRRLRARNIESREAYERELASTKAEHERAAAAV